jgi:DNA-binding LytR/AlgR family response regulator
MIFLILIFPYSILALSLRIWEYHEKSIYSSETDENRRMRFYDSKHNLKIVLVPDAILYIAAEENYINIYYLENSKVRNYVLRSSMKAVEELCIDNGLVRCHRSFFINPSHVKVLRKEQEGVVYAELDSPEARHIPVTKRYYDHLSEML